jgi:hypothetical protein
VRRQKGCISSFFPAIAVLNNAYRGKPRFPEAVGPSPREVVLQSKEITDAVSRAEGQGESGGGDAQSDPRDNVGSRAHKRKKRF